MAIKKESKSVSPSYSIFESDKGKLSIYLHGSMDIKSAASILTGLKEEILSRSLQAITIELDRISYIDEYGATVISELKKIADNRNTMLTLSGKKKQSEIDGLLKRLDSFERPGKFKKDRENLFVRIGDAALIQLSNIKYFISFLGSVILSFIVVIRRPKSLRLNDTLTCMEKTGVNAVPIVALISFLLGLVMAFMSSLQLRQFGANIYVASLVSIAMVSELGPIMTAIIVAGRSGSAFAAEIGTMKISEEVDALFIMGFNPTTFLGVPRIVASMIVVPILTLFSDLFAIVGGLVIGILALDLTFNSYVAQTLKTLSLFEVVWGLSKSMVFAIIIAWIGCLRGFQTRGGADAVGNSATSAVVTSIFLIILFDSFFAVARSYLW